MSYRAIFVVLVLCSAAFTQDRPGLFFREDWKETPAALPVTAEHVANPDIVFTLHGPGGKEGIKKSHHDKPADDPYYIWMGDCKGNCAISLRHRNSWVDLTGLAKVRWRTKQSGFRQARLIVKTGGRWYVSDYAEGPSTDWRVTEINIGDIRWRNLNIDTVIEGAWADKVDLTRVEEIGWTDLMPGGATPASTRMDWIEVYGKPVQPSAAPAAQPAPKKKK